MADLVLTITAPQAAALRVAHVVGVTDNLGHDASKAEVEAHIRDYFARLVRSVEDAEAVSVPLNLT